MAFYDNYTEGYASTGYGTQVFFTDDEYITEHTTKSKIWFIDSIPELATAEEPVEFNIITTPNTLSVAGAVSTSSVEIPMVMTKGEYKGLSILAKQGLAKWWYIRLPDISDPIDNKPVTYSFKATVKTGTATISGEVMGFTLRLYYASAIRESDDLPKTAQDIWTDKTQITLVEQFNDRMKIQHEINKKHLDNLYDK